MICMVPVLSANDIPGEGTLSFLAREIWRADSCWGPDDRVTGAAAPMLTKKKMFSRHYKPERFPISAFKNWESVSAPEWDSSRYVLTNSCAQHLSKKALWWLPSSQHWSSRGSSGVAHGWETMTTLPTTSHVFTLKLYSSWAREGQKLSKGTPKNIKYCWKKLKKT